MKKNGGKIHEITKKSFVNGELGMGEGDGHWLLGAGGGWDQICFRL